MTELMASKWRQGRHSGGASVKFTLPLWF